MALVKWGVQVCEICNCILDDDLKCPECEICNGEKMEEKIKIPTVDEKAQWYLDRIDQAKEEEKFDEVNNPPHYTIRGGIECIDYIKQVLGPEGFAYWCWGNVIKYQHRHEYKGKPIQDMEKAQFYLNKWIETRKGMRK